MGTFRFKDVTQGNATFWPTIASLSISNNQPCQLAVLSASIVDNAATIVMENKDELTVEYAEDNVTFVLIFAGDLNSCVLTDLGRSDPRVYQITAQDYTKRLADNIIDAQRLVEESVSDRVDWIMGHSTQGITTGGVASIATLVDPRDYRGMSVRQALEEVAGEVGASFYVDFDKELQYFVTPPVVAAPFDLVHPANPTTSYPYWNFALTQDTDEYAEAVYVQGDGLAIWRGTQGTYERAYSDPSIKTVRKAERVGDRILADLSEPVRKVSLTVTQPGLVPGQTVHVTNPSWAVDEDFLVSATQLRALDPNPGGLIEMDVTLADRFTPCYLRSPSAGDLSRGDNNDTTTISGCDECLRKTVLLPSGMDENISLATGGNLHVYDGSALRKYSCALNVIVTNDSPPTVGLPYIKHEPGTHTALIAGDAGLYGDPNVGTYGAARWTIDDEIDVLSADVTDRRTFWVGGTEV